MVPMLYKSVYLNLLEVLNLKIMIMATLLSMSYTVRNKTP